MSTQIARQKLIIATAPNFLAEVNQIVIENVRKQRYAELQVPSLIDRAFMLVHETGVMPIADTAAQTSE